MMLDPQQQQTTSTASRQGPEEGGNVPSSLQGANLLETGSENFQSPDRSQYSSVFTNGDDYSERHPAHSIIDHSLEAQGLNANKLSKQEAQLDGVNLD